MDTEKIKKEIDSPYKAIFEVGPYTIVERYPRNFVNGTWTPRNGYDRTRTEFVVFVDDISTASFWPTLDMALLHAVAHRNLEINEARYATLFCARALGLDGMEE